MPLRTDEIHSCGFSEDTLLLAICVFKAIGSGVLIFKRSRWFLFHLFLGLGFFICLVLIFFLCVYVNVNLIA